MYSIPYLHVYLHDIFAVDHHLVLKAVKIFCFVSSSAVNYVKKPPQSVWSECSPL